MDNYTTTDKISAITDIKEQEIEQKKSVISNDAYAIVDLINSLIDKLEEARYSLVMK